MTEFITHQITISPGEFSEEIEVGESPKVIQVFCSARSWNGQIQYMSPEDGEWVHYWIIGNRRFGDSVPMRVACMDVGKYRIHHYEMMQKGRALHALVYDARAADILEQVR